MFADPFESIRMGAGSPPPKQYRPSHKRMDSLPQHGYPAATSFASLIEDNPFLFRVYTPKRSSRTRIRANSDPFFIGAKFDDEEEFFSDAEFDGATSDASGSVMGISKATYADAIRHLDWKQRSSSPYISTSFSFAWAIWEANRRYQDGVKHDVHIAVIDARALIGRATTAMELLRKGNPSQRHRDHNKYFKFASEAQNVLVFGCIPATTVLASVPLLSVLPKLPSYFAKPAPEPKSDSEDVHSHKVLTPPPSPTPFAVVFKDKPTKSSYKQFCQELSDRFLQLPEDARLQDTSAHAVRLAVALLRPWLHRSLPGAETEEVQASLCSLALLVAQWPAQWWTRDNNDVETIVRGMVEVVVQEIKETRRVHALEEVERMQDVVNSLKRTADDLERRQGHSALVTETNSVLNNTDSSVYLPPPYTSNRWMTGPPPRLESPPAKTLSPVASALISGLLFGSFCMLSIIHSQRWELANHLT